MTQTEALLLSIAIEAPVAAVLVGALRRGSPWRAGAAAVVGTVCTHWAVWAVMPELTPHFPYFAVLAGVEGAVVLAETPAYRVVGGLPWRVAAVVSLATNAASTAAGLLIYALR